MDWAMFGAMCALFTINITIMLWLFNKLDNDMKAIATEAKADSRALNARVDTTQGAIMRMLEQQAIRLNNPS